MRAATGRPADTIGHSQGGLRIRWAPTYWPGLRGSVDDVVSPGTPGYGAVAGDPVRASSCAPARRRMSRGSAFLTALDAGDPTPGPVSHTGIHTRNDTVVVPCRTSVREGARSIELQDVCGIRLATRIGLVYDSMAFRLVRDALDRPGPADPARLPPGACLGDPHLPGVGAAEPGYAAAVVAPAAARAEPGTPGQTLERLLRSHVDFVLAHTRPTGLLVAEPDQLPEKERTAARQARREYPALRGRLFAVARPGTDAAEGRIAVSAVLTVVDNAPRTGRLGARPDPGERLVKIGLALLRAG
ncbi:hypothetical protein ABZ714_03055 [Streptomyces sp. NPDC006798]|uniref:hypothetical protein n=1 Tax=Streptomyces sp. NPDC006798 TaxID=3155462 RepID=UPI0033EA9D95